MDTLQRLSAICQVDADEHLLGVPLHFICQPAVITVLTRWSVFNEQASNLLALATCLTENQTQWSNYHPLPLGKPMVEQFHGITQRHAFTMMIGSYVPGTDPGFITWFQTLKCWAVIEGLEIFALYQLRDKHLDNVATHIRLAADSSPSRLQLIREIQVRAESPETLRQNLSRAIHMVHSRKVPDEQGFLVDLHKVANGNRKLVEADAQRSSLFDGLTDTPKFSSAPPPISEVLREETESSYQSPGAHIFSTDVPAHATASERNLTGRGILLRTAKELQFLPWDGNKPNPLERSALESAIENWKTSEQAVLSALSWITQLSVLSSRSLRLVEKIEISDQTSADWRIHPSLAFMHRMAPRRDTRWKCSPDNMDWLQPIEQHQTFPTPKIPECFRSSNKATMIGDLWSRISEDSAEHVFNETCKTTPGLEVLSSGQIAGLLGQATFEATHDGVLTQLLAKHERAGLAGNCAYASYTKAKVRSTLQSVSIANIDNIEIESGTHNAAGSELSVAEERFIDLVVEANQRLCSANKAEHSFIGSHNNAVTYTVTALLAACGARPINDPFESPKHFDFVLSRIFLSDKTHSSGRGRLVPLPTSAINLVRSYQRHLSTVAQGLKDLAPALSQEAELLAQGEDSLRLPFFFYLNPKSKTGWTSVTEQTLDASPLFNSPLPSNVWRHRFSQRLRDAGIDPELIDSLMGHADHSVATHCDHSPRTWQLDMATIEPTLNATYQQLGFLPELPAFERSIGANSRWLIDTKMLDTHRFGGAAREQDRLRYRRNSLAQVKSIIRKTLLGRDPEQMTPSDWDTLVLDLTMVDRKRPHPLAAERYALFKRWQGFLDEYKAVRRGKVFAVDRPHDPVFTPVSVSAQANLLIAKNWFARLLESIPPSKRSAREQRVLCVLDLLLQVRITNVGLIADVLAAQNIRLVRFGGKSFMEHHPALDEHRTAPVTRYQIPHRTALWLASCLEQHNRFNYEDWQIPQDWNSSLLQCDLQNRNSARSLINWIRTNIEQCNYIERPGLVAGFLSGNLCNSSLPHSAWMLERGLSYQAPKEKDELSAETLTIHRKPMARFTEIGPVERLKAVKLVRKLFAEEFDKHSTKSRDHKHSSKDIAISNVRRNLSSELRAILDDHAQHLSTANWALFQWIIALTTQKHGRNHYALSSISRYLSAIGKRFIEVGYDFDLLGSDGESLTDFYADVLATDRNIDLNYVGARLQQFHRFVQQQFHVDEPDWDEIDFGGASGHGSPGTLGFEQYTHALQALCPDSKSASHESLAQGTLTILAFRFGLRGDDAWGLTLGDVWIQHRMMVVRVQPNAIRPLKRRKSGRRVIPLVEKLTESEWSILNTFIELARALNTKRSFQPLFARGTEGKVFELSKLRDPINAALKHICCDKNITLHKARHAFAMRMCSALMESELSAPNNQPRKRENRSTRKLLLATDRPTRRAPWALAALMGHAHPRTAFKSYIHQLCSYSDSWNSGEIEKLDSASQVLAHPRIRDLDLGGKVLWCAPGPIDPLPRKDQLCTYESVIDYIELMRAGASSAAARRAINIEEHLADRIDSELKRILFVLKQRAVLKDGKELVSVVSQISDTDFNRLKSFEFHSDQTPAAQQILASTEVCEWTDLVSQNRQILLWQRKHFAWAKALLRCIPQLRTYIRLNDARGKNQTVQTWIEDTGLRELIDVAQFGAVPDLPVVGDPPEPRINRCALQAKGANFSGFTLAAVWVIVGCLATQKCTA